MGDLSSNSPPDTSELPFKKWRAFVDELIAYYESRIPYPGTGLTENNVGGTRVFDVIAADTTD